MGKAALTETIKAGVKAFAPYCLRHTALTRLAEAGCDALTLARIAGVGRGVPPDLVREAVFSYTVVADVSNSEEMQSEVSLLTELIAQASFNIHGSLPRWPAGAVVGEKCMVRRASAREIIETKSSLRKCIRQ